MTKDLRILEDAGLVVTAKRGRNKYYLVYDEPKTLAYRFENEFLEPRRHEQAGRVTFSIEPVC